MKKILVLIIALLSMSLMAGCIQNNAVIPQDLQTDDHGTEVLEKPLDEHQKASEIAYGNNYKGYLVEPNEPGNYPGVVIIHEWWGLNDNIKQEANNLAKEGYVVLAVDLYDGKVADTPEKAREYAGAARNNADASIAQMKAAVNYLKSKGNVADSIASMGWCFGGGMSLQLALNEDLDATVIYYGSLETNASKLSSIDWPVLGVFGIEDTGIPVTQVREFESALNKLNIENEIYVYDGVGHAFANPSNPGHDAAKTKDAWDKTVLFLNKHLKNSAQK